MVHDRHLRWSTTAAGAQVLENADFPGVETGHSEKPGLVFREPLCFGSRVVPDLLRDQPDSPGHCGFHFRSALCRDLYRRIVADEIQARIAQREFRAVANVYQNCRNLPGGSGSGDHRDERQGRQDEFCGFLGRNAASCDVDTLCYCFQNSSQAGSSNKWVLESPRNWADAEGEVAPWCPSHEPEHAL